MFAKRKLDLDEQKTRVIQAVKGLGMLSQRRLYKEYFDMTDEEIDQVLKELDEEAAEQMEQQAAMQPQQFQQPQGGPLRPSKPGYGEAGGQEGQENAAPTGQPQQPPVAENLSKLTSILNVSYQDQLILERIIEKESNKVKKS
jgi:hypothetical protein